MAAWKAAGRASARTGRLEGSRQGVGATAAWKAAGRASARTGRLTIAFRDGKPGSAKHCSQAAAALEGSASMMSHRRRSCKLLAPTTSANHHAML
eukprot:365677-Chlamydomonas_euryale.AAC.1